MIDCESICRTVASERHMFRFCALEKLSACLSSASGIQKIQ